MQGLLKFPHNHHFSSQPLQQLIPGLKTQLTTCLHTSIVLAQLSGAVSVMKCTAKPRKQLHQCNQGSHTGHSQAIFTPQAYIPAQNTPVRALCLRVTDLSSISADELRLHSGFALLTSAQTRVQAPRPTSSASPCHNTLFPCSYFAARATSMTHHAKMTSAQN